MGEDFPDDFIVFIDEEEPSYENESRSIGLIEEDLSLEAQKSFKAVCFASSCVKFGVKNQIAEWDAKVVEEGQILKGQCE